MVTETISYGDDSYIPNPLSGALRVTVDISENVGFPDDPPSLNYRLRITASNAQNMDSNIFVFEVVPDSAGRAANQVRFVTVATPAYMQELPILEPNVDEANYYYRSDSVDLYFRDIATLATARDNILRRITLLLESIESMIYMRQQMTIDYEFDTDETWSSSEVTP